MYYTRVTFRLYVEEVDDTAIKLAKDRKRIPQGERIVI